MDDKMKKYVVERLMTYFISRITSNDDFVYNFLDSELKTVLSFFDYFKKNKTIIGNEFLANYFEFQFNYWIGCDILYSKIRIAWIIGPKAIERWKNKKYTNSFLTDIRKNIPLSIKSLIEPVNGDFDFTEPYPHEEKEKQLFLNQPCGLMWCIQNTTLINPNSEVCGECKFKNDCKDLLKVNFPKLYKKRYV